MPFISVMKKLNFQKPLLQFTVSHDHSKIILTCWFGVCYYQCGK